MVVIELVGYILSHLLDLLGLLNFQLLHQIERSLLVVLHVLVPGVGELRVLDPLGVLDVEKLPLLGNLHVMLLSLLLVAAPPIENLLELVGHHIVSHGLVPLSHLVHYSTGCGQQIHNGHLLQKCHDPLVGQEVHSRLRKQSSIFLPIEVEH